MNSKVCGPLLTLERVKEHLILFLGATAGRPRNQTTAYVGAMEGGRCEDPTGANDQHRQTRLTLLLHLLHLLLSVCLLLQKVPVDLLLVVRDVDNLDRSNHSGRRSSGSGREKPLCSEGSTMMAGSNSASRTLRLSALESTTASGPLPNPPKSSTFPTKNGSTP